MSELWHRVKIFTSQHWTHWNVSFHYQITGLACIGFLNQNGQISRFFNAILLPDFYLSFLDFKTKRFSCFNKRSIFISRGKNGKPWVSDFCSFHLIFATSHYFLFWCVMYFFIFLISPLTLFQWPPSVSLCSGIYTGVRRQ